MKRMLFFLFLILIFQTSQVFLVAEETWQGNAAISLRGELTRDGYFAASNAFPRGTRITVTNLDNGKSVTVTVAGRLNGNMNVFLLLSENAGKDIGLNPKDIARITTRVVGISNDLTGTINEYTYNPDADTNPALRTPEVDRTTIIAEATPTPGPTFTPTPRPTPAPDRTQADVTRRGLEKDRFSRPYGGPEGDVSTRKTPPLGEREAAREVELKEARVPLKDRAEAVIIMRPKTETESALTASGEENLPKVAARERGETNEYYSPDPLRDEVIAILIEPRGTIVREDGTVTTVNRPSLDQESIEIALTYPELRATEKPFIYERHGLGAEKEEIALASLDLPEVSQAEKATVDAYVMKAQDQDRVVLETHILPEIREGEKPDVNAIAKTEQEKDRVTLKSYNLPDIKEREKPDVTQKPNVEGKDKTETDIALVPTNPRPPVKKENGTTTTTITEPDKTTTTVIRESGTEYLRNYYYLQIGVYKNRRAAENILKANPAYPMMIVSGTINNATVYKVVVGPLRRDESGTVLYLFRARGYRDAFIRFIN